MIPYYGGDVIGKGKMPGRAQNERKTDKRDMFKHTSYCPSLLCILAANEEDDIALGGVNVVVLEEEYFVDTIFLKRAEFDEQTDRPSQGLLNDEVLLASDLQSVSDDASQSSHS